MLGACSAGVGSDPGTGGNGGAGENGGLASNGGQSGPGPGGGGGNGAGGANLGGNGGGAAQAGAGGGGSGPQPPVEPPQPGQIVISEIMYHPVEERADADHHEFIELHNRGATAVSLAGWKIAGVGFTFPAGATIGPGAYLAVAKDRAALAAIPEYGLAVEAIAGDFPGALDNGGEQLVLTDEIGAVVDAVKYDDELPWPIGADALGADEEWLPAAWLCPGADRLACHRHKGRSLERIAFDRPATVENWAPTEIDKATPGKPNGARGTPPTIALLLSVTPDGAPAGALVRAADRVRVRVELSAGTIGDVQIEAFADNIEATDASEPRTLVPAVPVAATPGVFEAVLPARPDRSVVRYRILGDRGDGAGRVTISPRPSDPFAWHAYFVSPNLPGQAPVYHLFIRRADWGQLEVNVMGERTNTCAANPSWNAKVPAIFVAEDGRVYDVFARYQGSAFNRKSGAMANQFPANLGPTRTQAVFQALSWHLYLPDYQRMANGRKDVVLNKLYQACAGLVAQVASRLFEQAGIPAPQVRYVRYYINGGYFRYMMEIETPDQAMLKRFWPQDPVGDLFKASGAPGEEGAIGWADERELAANPMCAAFTPSQRYAATYDRKTNAWRGHSDEVMQLVQAMHAARRGGAAAMRKFIEDNFDVALLTTYFAMMQWLGPWDDYWQNHLLYQRGGDGRWVILPWDFDLLLGTCGRGNDNTTGMACNATFDFGGYVPPTASFFIGEEANRSNRRGYWNRLKDTFFKAFRAELQARVQELAAAQLETAAVTALVDEAAARYSQTEATAAYSRPDNYFCGSVATQIAAMKAFIAGRNQRIAAGQFQ